VVDRVMAGVGPTRWFARWSRLLPVASLFAILPAAMGQQVVAHAAALPGTAFAGTYASAAGTRSYVGYVPSGYHSGTALPLVVALHGCTESSQVFRQLSHLDSLAEARNFIVVYPNQDSHANPMSCWNWFQSQDMKRGSGEPAIIAGLTQWVESHYSVDPNRVYLTGFSAGGAMADVMGATYPDLYAAIGIGSGIQYGGIDPTLSPTKAGQEAFDAMGSHAREMPVLIFHGGQDNIVSPSHATDLVQQWQTTDNLAVAYSVPSSPTRTVSQQSSGGQTYTVTHYANSGGQDVIQSWLVPSMSHAWSGGCGCQSYANPSGPDESSAMYDFFLDHPMSTGTPGAAPGGWSIPGWPPAGWTFPTSPVGAGAFPWPLTGWPLSALRIPGLS
jgi:poly(hydroxyalkanoate) depolymerase family esterase